MKLEYKNSNLIYKKLKLTDYEEFNNLFYSCFKKRISFKFFKWRYFSDKSSFCYGVFDCSKLIANIGLVSNKINNKTKDNSLSRHSSMVLKKYRGKGIFSNLSQKVKKIIINKISLVCMWPNKKNLSNFGIDKNYLIKKKYYLYKSFSKKNKINQTINYNIKNLFKFKDYIIENNNFFLKDFDYFKKRYLLYKKNEYSINEFKYKNLKSFFIIKKNYDSSGYCNVVLEHFGCNKIKLRHFSCLISEKNKLVFLAKKKIYKHNFKLLYNLKFNIGFLKNKNKNYKKFFLNNNEICLGDTDIFITI